MRLIDADAIPYETHYVPDGETEWEYKEEQCVCKSSIDEMPTIKARPVVRGEWIRQNWSVTCSVCGSLAIAHDGKNYCPYCGAEMRGSER